jgi:chromosome segregation ATPase
MISVSKFKAYIYIATIFFIIGFGVSYYIGRTDVSNLRERIAEYKRCEQQYNTRERELENTINRLQSELKSITELGRHASEQSNSIAGDYKDINTKIGTIGTNIDTSKKSSDRIKTNTRTIDEITQRIYQRNAERNK